MGGPSRSDEPGKKGKEKLNACASPAAVEAKSRTTNAWYLRICC
jgi:hypothetical protein